MVRQYLDMLAVEQQVRVAMQHQALNAIVRFYAEVLGRKVEGAEGYLRARSTDRVPVVLSRGEVGDLLAQLEGTERLMGELMYGGGLLWRVRVGRRQNPQHVRGALFCATVRWRVGVG